MYAFIFHAQLHEKIDQVNYEYISNIYQIVMLLLFYIYIIIYYMFIKKFPILILNNHISNNSKLLKKKTFISYSMTQKL